MEAIRIIQAEHRSLGAVLHGMGYLVRQIRYAGAPPEFDVFVAMIRYIETFTEQLHHPKEDQLLGLLRVRCLPAAPLVDRLAAEHRVCADMIATLKAALAEYQQRGAAAFAAFATSATTFAAFHYDHMRLEETEALPLAKIHLKQDDWKIIDKAFTSHVDPLTGVAASTEHEKLFRRIVELARPPLGKASVRLSGPSM